MAESYEVLQQKVHRKCHIFKKDTDVFKISSPLNNK